MANENETPITLSLEKLKCTVEIGDAVCKFFMRRAAEFRQITRARNPVMTARVDDEAVMAARGQFLAKGKQRREVKVHGHAVNQYQCDIRFLVRRQQRAMQPFVVGGFEGANLGSIVHELEI